MSKLINMALGFSIDLSTQNVIYQPLPPQQRARTKTMADGIIQPLGNGIAGLMLLILTTVLALNTVQLSYILLLIVACWLVVVQLHLTAYRRMLARRGHPHQPCIPGNASQGARQTPSRRHGFIDIG